MAFLYSFIASSKMENWQRKSLLCIALGVLLVLPSLWAGLFADDLSHAVLLTKADVAPLIQPENSSLANLFTFVTPEPERRMQLMSKSLMPWWTTENFSMVFFRPLAELTHLIDYQLLSSPFLMHLHSLLWYIAVLFMLRRFYRSILPVPIALTALLMFVLDASHGFTLAWLANRNALMALFFSLAASLVFLKLVSSGKEQVGKQDAAGQTLKSLLWMSVLIILAFLSGEIGISVGVLLLVIALFYTRSNAKHSLAGLAVAFALFILWQGFYQYEGYGASGNSAYYADPLAEPMHYFSAFVPRFLSAISMLFNILPVHFLWPESIYVQAFGLTIFVALTAYVLYFKQSYLYAAYWVTVLSIVPVLSAEVQERNLLFANVGSSILLADVMWRLLSQVYSIAGCSLDGVKGLPKSFSFSLACRSLLVLILIGHLILSGLIMLPMTYAPKLMAQENKQISEQLAQILRLNNTQGEVAAPEDTAVFIVGLPLFSAAYITPKLILDDVLLPRTLLNISSQPDLQISLVSKGTEEGKRTKGEDDQLQVFDILVSEGKDFFSATDRLLRDVQQDPFYLGQRFSLDGASLEILALGPKGEPQQLRLYSEAKNVHFLRWQASRLKPMPLLASQHTVETLK